MEQRVTAGTGLCPATQYCTLVKNRLRFGYIRRLGWPLGSQPGPLNQIWQEHTQTHGSVSWDHMPDHVGTPVHGCSKLIAQVGVLLVLYTFIAQ
jgi:hypothetical protein